MIDVGTILGIARAFRNDGRLVDARNCCEFALSQTPDNLEVRQLHGCVLIALGQVEEGVQELRRATDYSSTLPPEFLLDESVAAYQQAIANSPECAETFVGLGGVLHRAGRFEQAVDAYRHAQALRPDDAMVLQLLGGSLCETGNFGDAVAVARKAVGLSPTSAGAHANLGVALARMNRAAEAVTCFEQALALAPCDARTRMNLAVNLLRSGSLAVGWDHYESRFQTLAMAPQRMLPQEAWNGQFFQSGTRMLLRAEQGHGDTLQFVRYGPRIAARGAVVLLEVQPALTRLLSLQHWVDTAIAQGETLPPHALHCPIMSLPRAFGTEMDTIPAEIPYLRADCKEVEVWRQRLAPLKGLRVGLAWAGGTPPWHNEASLVDRRRSMQLAQFAPLVSVSGVQFVSLQKGLPSRQASRPPDRMSLLNWSDELHDFADTAALIKVLDLVISVDTAVAHLAGALGKPVWLLNRFDACWRWLLDRDDSPWYPTMRIFRQTTPGDWNTVMQSVSAALATAAADADTLQRKM